MLVVARRTARRAVQGDEGVLIRQQEAKLLFSELEGDR
jgi:hypothetical protein